MKKSTIKLIIFTILGLIASIILYQINKHPNPMMIPRTVSRMVVGMYICPFFGIIYWLFCRHIDE